MRSRRASATRTYRLLLVALVTLGLVAGALPVSARPYGARGASGEVRYGVPASQVRHRCSTMTDSAGRTLPLCVHWATAGQHLPRDGWVGETHDAFQRAWNVAVRDGGYRRPLPDGGSGAGQGPNRGLDVYIADIDGDGTFGFCAGDRGVTGEQVPAYCVVDNNFSAVSGATAKVRELRGTAAHEFFHAVQYAYDRTTPEWFSEGTAVWMEDVVFDGGNTNRRYLDITALRQPEDPLDRSGTGYGAWLFWQFLAEKYGRNTVRSVWNRVAARDGTEADVFAAVAGQTDNPLGQVLATFGAWNYGVDAGWSYGEGDGYFRVLDRRRPPLDAEHVLDGAGSSTDVTGADAGRRSIVAGPRSIHYVRIEAATTMDITIEVPSPGAAKRLRQTATGQLRRPESLAADGTTAMTLQAGEAVVLVLTNPSSTSRTLRYRAEAQP